MAKIRLIPGQAGSVMSSQGMRDLLADLAETVASRAQATAPRESGAYAASIDSYVEQVGDRAVGIVSTISPYGAKVEAATGNLARALGTGRG